MAHGQRNRRYSTFQVLDIVDCRVRVKTPNKEGTVDTISVLARRASHTLYTSTLCPITPRLVSLSWPEDAYDLPRSYSAGRPPARRCNRPPRQMALQFIHDPTVGAQQLKGCFRPIVVVTYACTTGNLDTYCTAGRISVL